MSHSMTRAQQTIGTRKWSIEGFKSFWGGVNLALVPLLHEVGISDIVGYWPRPIGVVRGMDAYIKVIDAIFRVCPDLSLTVAEYMRSDNLHFIRWVASGSIHDSRFKCDGCDRVRTTDDGRVSENYVFCDHPFFADVAADLTAMTWRVMDRRQICSRITG